MVRSICESEVEAARDVGIEDGCGYALRPRPRGSGACEEAGQVV